MILSDRDGGLGVLLNCASTDAIGSPVRISGINTVTSADASSFDRSQVVGFIITKPTPTTCYISNSLYYSAASGFSGFSGIAGSSNSVGQPVYLTNSSGFSGLPGTSHKVIGESLSPREALLRADTITAASPDMGSFKNKFINGAFNVWQYGISSVNTGGGGIPDRVDRFVVFHSSDGTVTHQRAIPSLLTYPVSGTKVEYASQLSVTVADTNLTGDQRLAMYQVIEGYNARTIAYAGFTFSFWMYGNQGVYSAFAGDNTYYNVQHFTLPNNTWTRIKVTFPPNPNYAGSTTNGVGLVIGVTLAMSPSSTLATANLGNWQNAGKIGSTTQSNGLSSNTNIFYTSLWQVEEGPVATKFEDRPFGTEFSLCQRYFEKSNGNATYPGDGADTVRIGHGVCDSTNSVVCLIPFLVEKRTTTPTITFYRSTLTATANRLVFFNGSVWADVSAQSGSTPTNRYLAIAMTHTATFGLSYAIAGGWTVQNEF